MEPNEVEAYLVHRLAVAGWQGRPSFEAGSFESLHRHSDGIPRKLNQLAARLLLYAGMEKLDAITASAVESVAADMAGDRPQAGGERVLPLRPVAPSAPAPSFEPSLERRVAAIEARLDEQEKAVRRVLTLLVDWVENGSELRRSNAA
jgi:hypothetical protein